MRSVSSAFAAAIASGTVKITELYILELADGTTYRYTTHNQQITWDEANNTYEPVAMERGEVTFTTNFEVGEVAVALSNISTDISSDVNNDILEGAVLTIKRIRWDASYAADEEFIVFKGFLDIDFNRKILNLSAKSKFANLNVQIPKFLYEECCNYNLFDDLCGLTRANYAYAGTATGGSRTTLTDSNRGSVYKTGFDGGDLDNQIERGDIVKGGDSGYTAKVVQTTYLTSSTGYTWYVELSDANNFANNEDLSVFGIQEYYNTGADSIFSQDSSSYYIGETFKSDDDFEFVSIKLKMYRSSGTTGTLTLKVYATDENHEPTGALLASGTLDISSLTIETSGDWYEITLDNSYGISADVEYCFYCEASIASGAVDYKMDSYDATYSNGAAIYSYNSGADWYVRDDPGHVDDLMFEIYGLGSKKIVVNGTPAADSTFYELGELEMTSGNNNGQKRPIALDSENTVTVLWPFVNAVTAGDDYNLYPGCDLRGVTCNQKFDNKHNFRGFLYVPRVEGTIV